MRPPCSATDSLQHTALSVKLELRLTSVVDHTFARVHISTYSCPYAAINEFTAPRWQTPYQYDPSQTLGHYILSNRGLFTCAPYDAPNAPVCPACRHLCERSYATLLHEADQRTAMTTS